MSADPRYQIFEVTDAGSQEIDAFLAAALPAGRGAPAAATASPDAPPGAPARASARVIAVRDGDMIAALVPFAIEADLTGALGAPLFHPRARATRGSLIALAAAEVLAQGATVAHTALAPGDGLEAAFLEAGFVAGSLMLVLTRSLPFDDAPETFTGATAECRVGWIPYGPERAALFADVFYATLDGSLDCSDLPVCRDRRRLMQSFEERGDAGPEDFALLEEDGAPVGILLCTACAREMEIAYLGVTPRARGRGLGAALVDRAFERARARGAARLAVTVDSANAPAVALYLRRGFSENRAVRVYHLTKK